MGEIYDVAVIGGGVNGAGIARDVAGRGAKVLLLEARDLANGTSSASTKLIHGGLRYLEHYEFALVREALSEREALWRIAPHIISPLRFVLPHMNGLRPAWLLRLGLFLYDHIGGRKLLGATRSINLSIHPAGRKLKPGFSKGFEYSDCRVDDARLVILNAVDAAEHGAQIRTRTPVTSARREGDEWLIETPEGEFRARALVNAAGPGVVNVLDAMGETGEFGIRRVRGSHIVTKKLFNHDYAYFFQLPDGRIFFAIPYEGDFTLIGTTDADHDGSIEDVRASEEEIAYLCEGVNRYFDKPITPADVVWTYSGVRALIDDGSGKPEAATRGYRLTITDADEGAPLLTVYGGKITSYRHLAEEAADRLAGRVPALGGPAWTRGKPLPGGDFPVDGIAALLADLAEAYPFLGENDIARIAKAYGTRAYDWLGTAKVWGDLGRNFGSGLSQSEIDYTHRVEWARTAEDILWRRSKLGLRLDEAQQAVLAQYLDTLL